VRPPRLVACGERETDASRRLLSSDALPEALALLQTELQAACHASAHPDLPVLATLLACRDKPQLSARATQLRQAQSARWRASADTRAFVMECLSPEVRCPPGRLLRLLADALQHQLGDRRVPAALPLFEDVEEMQRRRDAMRVPARAAVLLPAAGQVWAVALSPSEAAVALGLSDGQLVVVDVASQIALASAHNSFAVTQLLWAPEGILCVSQGPRRGVSSLSGSLVKVWHAALTSHVSLSGALHDGSPCAAWVDGCVATCGPDARARLWQPHTGACEAHWDVGERVVDVCAAGTGVLLAACVDRVVRGFACRSGAPLMAMAVDAPVLCMAPSASREHVALLLEAHVAVFHVASGSEVGRFPLRRSRFVHRPALDDEYVAFGDENGELAVHCFAVAARGSPVARLQGHTGPVNAVVWGERPRVRFLVPSRADVRARADARERERRLERQGVGAAVTLNGALLFSRAHVTRCSN